MLLVAQVDVQYLRMQAKYNRRISALRADIKALKDKANPLPPAEKKCVHGARPLPPCRRCCCRCPFRSSPCSGAWRPTTAVGVALVLQAAAEGR
jgi:hypothetical protein